MSLASALQSLRDRFKTTERMPLVFLGHGSPMNAIVETDYARNWAALGRALPRPQAILVVSAHWMSRGTTLVDVSRLPRTIHDFYGFPEALYEQQYPAPGAPDIAREVETILASHHAEGDDRWGLDHGAWSVLKWLFPEADVPVFQLSIDMSRDLDWQLEIGAAIKDLRRRGILILGSGNVVHNLRRMRAGSPWDWAIEFDQGFAERLEARDFKALADRRGMGALFDLAHPTPDHYLPALTVAGAAEAGDELLFMNDSIDIASVSMRSFVFY
ncbi:4,5-DOPA dioxygenase extradiol [Rhodobacter xanthinilyticus]|uniref:4,5-DOPA dioxygenase extradiol n=1 Tax=Rhodobacter xanthinilyticus TaxID=1850250 RepID=A0A1D9MCK9_9RHOB|nr:4,5-DOPA dioxygenase extradiol [Rhodobacter xanthinilyticus]AOZ69571.1 4,5-DOPA dioxygenase extradiol [Rhodobacter xanthinilyticus]